MTGRIASEDGVMVAPTVEDLVADLTSPRKALVNRMREIVKEALPEAVESVKCGQPVYSVNGTSIICFMLDDDHVNFGLFMGARLKSERLEGTGKGLRHIKVYQMKDVDEKEFARLARDAARLA
jgi:hypothetical protein